MMSRREVLEGLFVRVADLKLDESATREVRECIVQAYDAGAASVAKERDALAHSVALYATLVND